MYSFSASSRCFSPASRSPCSVLSFIFNELICRKFFQNRHNAVEKAQATRQLSCGLFTLHVTMHPREFYAVWTDIRTWRAGCVVYGVCALHIQRCNVQIDMGVRVPLPLHAAASWLDLKCSPQVHALLSTFPSPPFLSSRNNFALPALPCRCPENSVRDNVRDRISHTHTRISTCGDCLCI